MEDFAEQRDHNHAIDDGLEQHAIHITAGLRGLKVECGGREFYAADFYELLKLLDGLIGAADGRGAYELTPRLIEKGLPSHPGRLRLEKVNP